MQKTLEMKNLAAKIVKIAKTQKCQTLAGRMKKQKGIKKTE